MTHETKRASRLCWYSPWAKNDFHVFKWLKRIQKNNHVSRDVKIV